MIIGITGPICAGKTTLVDYLKQSYSFQAINFEAIFKAKLRAHYAAKRLAKEKKNQEKE
jgi:dephospho-CoA kinase